VGTVSIQSTSDPNLENKLVTSLSDTTISVLNTSIDYTIFSPFFPPYFPPYFPPSFCVCGTCTWGGSYSCEGTLSYEYYTCGCAGCPGEGGYNPAYRNGICGYVDPCAGYTCVTCTGTAGCSYKYSFQDCSGVEGCPYGAWYQAYGDPNCNCPATFADFSYCIGIGESPC
jgi:hypothetical protein